MRIKNIEDRIVYVPNRESGLSTFEGEALILDDLEEMLGSEVIDYTRYQLSKILDFRKYMFGNGELEYYGLHPVQRFYDLKEREMVLIRDLSQIDQQYYEEPIDRQGHDIVIEKERERQRYKTESNISMKRLFEHGSLSEEPNFIKKGRCSFD